MKLFLKAVTLCRFVFHPFFLLLLLAFLLLLPSILSGFFLDDYLFLQKLINEGVFPHLYNLFTFSSQGEAYHLIMNGSLPWWGNPEFKMDFFRPLSSLLFSLDFVIFGKHALGYHLSFFLLVFFLLSIWHAIFKILLPYHLNILALVILVTSGVFIFPVFFAANSHTLLATTLASLGLWSHLLYRHQHYKYGLLLSVLAFSAGLLASEAAVGILIYLFCYEWLFSKDGLYKRSLILLPSVFVLIIYVVIYKIFQYGTNNYYYFDPLKTPVQFLKNAFVQFPSLFNKLYFGFFFENHPIFNWMITILVSGILLIHFFNLKTTTKQVYKWFFASSVFSLFPVLTMVIDPHLVLRMLLPSMIGAAVIIASLIIENWERRNQLLSKRWWKKIFFTIYALYLIVVYFIFSPLMMLMIPKYAGYFNQHIVNTAMKISLNKDCEYVVSVAMPDYMTGVFLSSIRTFYHLPNPKNWYVLADNASSANFIRISPYQYMLETKFNHYSYDKSEQIFKNNQLKDGEMFQTKIFQATVITSINNTPTKILFTFNHDSFNKICWITFSPVKSELNLVRIIS